MQLLGEVEQHDAVLDHEADEENQSHRRRDVQVGTGQQQQQERAAERERRRQQDQNRRDPRPELDHQDREDEDDGQGEHHQQLAERLLLRLVLPANLVRVADWQRELVEIRPNLGNRASHVAPLEPCRHARHQAKVLALQFSLPVGALHVRDFGYGNLFALRASD